MSRAFSLVCVAAFFNDDFCSSRRISDHMEVPLSFSVATTLRSLSRILGRSMSKAGCRRSVLMGFVDDCPHVVQEIVYSGVEISNNRVSDALALDGTM